MDEILKMRRRFVELAPWHVNGTVSAVERAWVDRYVRLHPQARVELEWYASLQRKIRADAPEVSPDAGLERLLHRVRLERPPPRPEGALALQLGRVRDFFAAIFMRPACAYAAIALVVAQAGLIGALLFQQRDYAEYRSLPTAPVSAPLLRVTFHPEAHERDIRGALIEIGGALVGGPGQLGEYVVRVPPEKVEAAAARLRANRAVEAVEISESGPLPGQAPSRKGASF